MNEEELAEQGASVCRRINVFPIYQRVHISKTRWSFTISSSCEKNLLNVFYHEQLLHRQEMRRFVANGLIQEASGRHMCSQLSALLPCASSSSTHPWHRQMGQVFMNNAEPPHPDFNELLNRKLEGGANTNNAKSILANEDRY
jgi:hypothetical protein